MKKINKKKNLLECIEEIEICPVPKFSGCGWGLLYFGNIINKYPDGYGCMYQ